METFLSPVGLHGFGNIQSLGSVKQQGKNEWMERVLCEWRRRESGECALCVCVGGVVGGGKGYNRSHWNVEMCVYKRPVNSCLK